jgi:biopolymer transport protein ExbB/TolQ
MENQNLLTLVEHGGYVVLLLALCSILSVKVIIEKYFSFEGIREKILYDLKIQIFDSLDSGSLSETLLLVRMISWNRLMLKIKSPVSNVLWYIIGNSKLPYDELLENSYTKLDKEVAKLEKGLGILATLGSISPFIGLFGTVLGIIGSFNALSINSTSNYTQVMSGIADALIATAAGLVVAVPAVMFYNYFTKRLKLSLPLFDELIKDTIRKVKLLHEGKHEKI